MKKHSTAAALLLVGALALAGCTASPEPAPEAAQASPAAAQASPAAAQQVADAEPTPTPTPTPTKTADLSQAWADKMINLFLNGNSKSSFSEFNDELAHHYVKSWTAPKTGVLDIVVSGNKWTKCDMLILTDTVMMTAGWETPELTNVKAASENGKVIGEITRDQYEKRTSAVPDTCL